MIPYKLIFEIIFVLVLGALSFWFIHYERQIGYDKAVAEYTADKVKQEEMARKKEQLLTDALERAQNEANQREQTIIDLNNSARDSSDKLQSALDQIRTGLPHDSSAALTEHTATLTALLGECQREYRQMAENADRHYSDYKTLSDAWPK